MGKELISNPVRGALVALSAAVLAASPVLASDLRAQLREMAAAHGFEVEGLDVVVDADGKRVDGDVDSRLKALLSDYNYVVLRDAGGAIDKVLISSRRARLDGDPREHVVGIARRAGHHLVDGLLAGPGGVEQRATLIVDTGATTVVLPASMIRALGFRAGDLRDGVGHTANGKVPARLGMLRSVRIGDLIVRDVAVTFIDDDLLDGHLLLGMSFLGRFRFTIDDANNRMLLVE